MKDISINGYTYETNGTILRLKRYHNGGFLFVAQLSSELQTKIKEMFQ